MSKVYDSGGGNPRCECGSYDVWPVYLTVRGIEYYTLVCITCDAVPTKC